MLKSQINLKEGYLNIIHEASKLLSKKNTLKESLREILKILYSYWDAPVSFVALYERESSEIRIVESFGLTKKEAMRGIFKRGEGIVGSIFRNEIPAILTDLRTNSRYLNRTKLLKRFETDPIFIGVPIKVGGEKFGVLCVYKERGRNFSSDDAIKMLTTLATLIGLTKKMYDRMEEERKFWQEEKQILLSSLHKDTPALEGIIGISDDIAQVKETILRIADTETTVLITGESGTGKSLVARAIHNLSRRKNGPFATINCAAIPENLLESELFGYEKGAFTGAVSRKKGKFELANGGTLFLDEIGDMPLSLQAKLLNVLQDREITRLGGEESIPINVRVIAATNKNLEDLMRIGRFREDLYYRLNVLPIHIKPLRQRRDDIPILVDHFLKLMNKRHGKNVRITDSALKVLVNYSWPGNVRELENTIERLVVLNDTKIDESFLPEYMKEKSLSVPEDDASVYRDIPLAIESMERRQIEEALKKTGYVKSKAARLLGFTIRQLDYRIKKYNIRIKKF